MKALFASGRVADIIIGLTLAEAVFVTLYHRRTGRGPIPSDFLPTLAAGLSLAVALRLALSGAWWGWIALSLLAALLAHGFDVKRRWH